MQEDPQYVGLLLSSYLVAGRWFVSDWLDGAMVSRYGRPVLYAPSTRVVSFYVLEGGRSFSTALSQDVPRIIQQDIVADNGLLHIVDKVLKAGS